MGIKETSIITTSSNISSQPKITFTEQLRDIAMDILLDGKTIDEIEGIGNNELSEKVRKLSGDTAISIDEILGMLSNNELNRLEKFLAINPESHLIEIFKAFHDGERALDFYRQELGLKTGENDEELIKYLEKLILEIGDENEAWKFHKLISLLHAKNGRFGDAIDHLNKTLIFETEENLWRVCVHLGIYFEKMGDHEFARSFLTTAKGMNKNRASYIGRILAICSRDIKRLEMEKAA